MQLIPGEELGHWRNELLLDAAKIWKSKHWLHNERNEETAAVAEELGWKMLTAKRIHNFSQWSYFGQTHIHACRQTCLVTDPVTVKMTVTPECVFTVYSHHLRPLLNTVSVSTAQLVTHTPATVHRNTPQLTVYPHTSLTNTYCWNQQLFH